MSILNPPFQHPKLNPAEKPNADDDAAFALSKGGIIIGMKKEGRKGSGEPSEKNYFVGEDSYLLCIGATRSGKSRCLVVQSICTLSLAGESIVVSDPKAELYDYTAAFLKKLGYEVLVPDFKNPEKSQIGIILSPQPISPKKAFRTCAI